MILVTRFDGSTFFINAELIRSIEHTPDTVITLTTDYKIIVRDTAEQILDRIMKYQQLVRGAEFRDSLKNTNKEE
ncbi:MAG: flagellar FlbD family protein [Ignavibacteria bacterium]|nr:flagellar FlbD family protein [Ignavibacteria bacterium]